MGANASLLIYQTEIAPCHALVRCNYSTTPTYARAALCCRREFASHGAAIRLICATVSTTPLLSEHYWLCILGWRRFILRPAWRNIDFQCHIFAPPVALRTIFITFNARCFRALSPEEKAWNCYYFHCLLIYRRLSNERELASLRC